jgi:hypothetical protein
MIAFCDMMLYGLQIVTNLLEEPTASISRVEK